VRERRRHGRVQGGAAGQPSEQRVLAAQESARRQQRPQAARRRRRHGASRRGAGANRHGPHGRRVQRLERRHLPRVCRRRALHRLLGGHRLPRQLRLQPPSPTTPPQQPPQPADLRGQLMFFFKA
jgi:hypothetical protein